MLDLPIPDNGSIIIFSATNAPEGVEGGRVRQNIIFSAQTPLTISGGIVNDFCRIEPSGNTFTAAARTREAAGNAIFTVTRRPPREAYRAGMVVEYFREIRTTGRMGDLEEFSDFPNTITSKLKGTKR